MFNRPLVLIIIGFVLVMLGWIFPFLMVMHVFSSTFFLNFFSYAISLIGLILGISGSAMYVKLRKPPKN
jgi:hypothetical protein